MFYLCVRLLVGPWDTNITSNQILLQPHLWCEAGRLLIIEAESVSQVGIKPADQPLFSQPPAKVSKDALERLLSFQ